jgi:hypothetical protein
MFTVIDVRAALSTKHVLPPYCNKACHVRSAYPDDARGPDILYTRFLVSGDILEPFPFYGTGSRIALACSIKNTGGNTKLLPMEG